MSERIQMALFSAEITKDNNTQKALLCVYIEDKVYDYTLFTHTNTEEESDMTVHVMRKAPPSDITSKILSLYGAVMNKQVEFNSVNIEVNSKDIRVLEKIDTELTLCADFVPYMLVDKEYTANARTLDQYLHETFDVSENVKDREQNLDSSTFAAARDKTDYNLFWDSDKITAEEKLVASPELNMDIYMSNYTRDTFKIVDKILTSKYAEKSYTAISLHGNPAGGKTEMIKAWCAFNHVPLIYIPCDPRMTIDRILSQIGPVSNADGKADLVKMESLLFKCLKYNLPAVVFFDEANLMSTEQQNALAPIISEGNFKDGPNLYHNNFTIKWVLAYNPNTTNAKSFDGKFYDRLNFVNVEDVNDKDRKTYRARRLLASMMSKQQADLSAIESQAKEMKEKNPDCVSLVNSVLNTLKRAPNSSQESLTWAFNLLTAPATQKAKIPGQFCPLYLDEVRIESASKITVASNKIHDFVKKVNLALLNQTKGKDTKNPDRSAYFYIADRAIDIFTDYIYSYRDVEAATHRIIMDLVPGGFTVRGQSVSANALDDPTPKLIADTICENLNGDMVELNNNLFTRISDAAAEKAKEFCISTQYIKLMWEKEEPKQEEVPEAPKETSDSGDDGLFDEMEKLAKETII